jgi:two-component system chemotaxis response regulator CheB
MHQMATKAHASNRLLSAKRYDGLALEAQQRADLIRKALFQGQLPVTVKADAIAQEAGNRELGVGNTESTDYSPHPNHHSPFKVVLLAASVGGLKALSQILPAFPPNFPAAIIVVQHLDTQSDPKVMTDTLYRPPSLPLKLAQEGEVLRPGMVYIAPPETHLLVNSKGMFCLSEAVFVDFIRPSADLLFQSVAGSFKERTIAVILSGAGNDGAMGVQAIHKMGGKVIAQDESTCDFFEMPNAAIQTGKVDFVLPVSAIASTLVNLVMKDSSG